MNTVMHVLQFTPSTLVRRRGEEAGQKVAAYVTAEALTVDFSETSPSLSFLDGLVLTLHQHGRLHDTTFISDDVMQKRLARISGKHDVVIYVRRAGDQERSCIA